MNIVMMTNTFTPHVGGVAKSVQAFTDEYRALGAQVLVVAPEFSNMPTKEKGVFRVQAIQNFNGSDFSVALPISLGLSSALEEFKPDIIHSHHPFLLGDTALRVAAEYEIPIVFTHHTMYEQYTHYVPGDSDELKRYVVELATGYADLCDAVIAPSDSIKSVLIERGVSSCIEVIPTGVNTALLGSGFGRVARQAFGIPADGLVIGHVGRLAPEKNLVFLSEAVAQFMVQQPRSYFLVVGDGPSREEMFAIFERYRLGARVRFAGVRRGVELVNAYHAMDLFAFASKSETQGMVLTEAFAAGVPVVALDAPGARDVLKTGINGILVSQESVTEFCGALSAVRDQCVTEKERLHEQVLQSAEQFSISVTAEDSLRLYDRLIRGGHRSVRREDSLWVNALRKFDIEWEIWSNRADALSEAAGAERIFGVARVRRLIHWYRLLRRSMSRSEWIVRLFGLSKTSSLGEVLPGLIVCQIDGLSRDQFERAIHGKRMPFLRKLINRDHYRLHSVYSGVPSTTPAVQGELFYGVRSCVPSFDFYDRASQSFHKLLYPSSANLIEEEISKSGEPLLKAGSSYSNIYHGGAAEAHFCASTLGWGSFAYSLNPFRLLFLLVSHLWSIVRAIALVIIEALLAVVDSFHGIIHGREFWKELKFIPTRVAICVLMREMITTGAKVDALRGLPIIYLNFLGYDEQAHRRGPESYFAHWSLKGIDRCIKSIWKTALRSPYRDYALWVCSDHGQESVHPFEHETGRTVQEVVAEAFSRAVGTVPHKNLLNNRGIEFQRLSWFSRYFLPLFDTSDLPGRIDPLEIVVTGLGPIGHVYLGDTEPEEVIENACQYLVREGGIPIVLRRDGAGRAKVWTGSGVFHLPEDGSKILGDSHPFIAEAVKDLVELCHGKRSGDLVLSGWRTEGKPLSFVVENGAHCGPGSRETHAFALIPGTTHLHCQSGGVHRWIDVREAVFRTLGRHSYQSTPPQGFQSEGVRRLRIMTYNVHSCIGTDGKLSPDRIARVIAHYSPDIVALQELDVGRSRSAGTDQARRIAALLDMEFHFHPSLRVESESYGNAVLSRFPIRVVKAGPLPQGNLGRNREPRGALWLEVTVDGKVFQIITTHLGLNMAERRAQIDALIGSEWLGSDRCKNSPVILCGDFNAMTRSYVYRRISEVLTDVHVAFPNSCAKQTWSSVFPVSRIDHVFVSSSVRVLGVEVPRTSLTTVASDHLPIIVDFSMVNDAGCAVGI